MPLRLRRGTDAQRLGITPAEGELVYTTDTKSVYVGDGSTVGGVALTTLASGMVGNLAGNVNLNTFAINGIGTIDIIGNISATGNGEVDGNLTVGGNVTATGEINGNHSGSFFADDSSTIIDGPTGTVVGPISNSISNIKITGGSNGQAIVTDGNGNLSFTTITGGGGSGTVNSGTASRIAYYATSGTTISDLSTVTWNSGTSTLSVSGNVNATNFSGNLTGNVFTSVITSTDSSPIFVTPALNIQSDLFVENELYVKGISIIENSLNLKKNISSVNSFVTVTGDTDSRASEFATIVGSTHERSGLVVYNDNNSGSALTIKSISGGASKASALEWETLGSTSTWNSKTVIQNGDRIGYMTYRGWNGSSYYFSSGFVAEVDSVVGPNFQSNVFLAVSDSTGAYKRFNFNGNGVFSAAKIRLGDGGSLASAPSKTANATLDIDGTMRLTKQTSAPASPVEGMIAVADGLTAGWDPKGTNLGVSYPCYFNGSVWTPFF